MGKGPASTLCLAGEKFPMEGSLKLVPFPGEGATLLACFRSGTGGVAQA